MIQFTNIQVLILLLNKKIDDTTYKTFMMDKMISKLYCGCCSVFLFCFLVRFRTLGRCIALMFAKCDARDILLAPHTCNDHEFCTFQLIKLLFLKLVIKTVQYIMK